MEYKRVKTVDVKVGDHFNRDYSDVEPLAVSISQVGLLHPIVVDSTLHLIAGERRLRACLSLGLDEVPVVLLDHCSADQRLEIELENEARRRDLAWQEKCFVYRALQEVKQKMHGPAISGYWKADRGWGIADTAYYLRVCYSTVNEALLLCDCMERRPETIHIPKRTKAWHACRRFRRGGFAHGPSLAALEKRARALPAEVRAMTMGTKVWTQAWRQWPALHEEMVTWGRLKREERDG